MATNANDVLVLLEFQQQWTKPGLFHALVSREMRRLDVMAKTITLTNAAREAAVPVLHAPLWVDPRNLKGLYAHFTRGLFFNKNSEKGKIDPRVLAASDSIITGRTAFDAFVGSELQEKLKPYKNHRILFAGFATDQCVFKTINTAQKHGFDAHLVADASATFFKFIQNRTERKLAGRVQQVAGLVQGWSAS